MTGLFILNCYLGYLSIGKEVFTLILVNVLIVVFLLGSLFLYYSIKNRKLYNITDTELGKGDMIMMVTLTPSLSVSNHLLFIIAAITLSIIVTLLFKFKSIPFAGIIALSFLMVELLKQLSLFDGYKNIIS